MKQMSVDEIKKVELNILKDVVQFCEQNNLVYFLAYGTLIGAVRHQGFIPWDDDIDIWMPRRDYEIFLDSYSSNCNRYRVISPKEKKARHSIAKVIDTKTIKIEEGIDYQHGFLGVDIDIFPLDGEPEKECEFIKWYRKLYSCYQSYNYLVVSMKSSKRAFLFSNLFKLLKIKKSKVLSKAKKIHNLYPYETQHYIGAIESVFNSPKNRFLKQWFSESVLLKFEDGMYKVPVEYDKILTQLYGDYMQLPTMDKQVTHHDNNCFWVEGSI